MIIKQKQGGNKQASKQTGKSKIREGAKFQEEYERGKKGKERVTNPMDVKSSDLHRRKNNNNNRNEGSEREKVEKGKR